jgi:hypothetical protein
MAATTFCTCIEAGVLEQQVVLLARSLRALPGTFARADLIAVQPRKGPGIAGGTRRQLAEMGVEYVRADLLGSYAWFDHLTKAAAMDWAERQVRTPYLTWIDGDFLFVRPPEGLLPPGDFGFAGAPGESDLGTDGADGNAPYWQHVAKLFGVPLDSGITMEAADDGRRIHEYYNGGVYTLAPDEEVSRRHFRYFKTLLDERISARSTGAYFNDMVALAMAARGVRRPRLAYDADLNFHLQPEGYRPGDAPFVQRIKLLHYHGSFYAPNAATAAVVETFPPQVREMVAAHTPFRISRMRLDRRLWRKAAGVLKARQSRRFEAACIRI